MEQTCLRRWTAVFGYQNSGTFVEEDEVIVNYVVNRMRNEEGIG